jgi:hypothetical protein
MRIFCSRAPPRSVTYMSDQQAVGAPVPGQQVAPPQGGGKGAASYDLHKCAMDAHVALEKLNTELGKSDAPDDVIKAVSTMSDTVGELARTFANMDFGGNPPAGQAGPPSSGSAPRETMASATEGLAQSARRP